MPLRKSHFIPVWICSATELARPGIADGRITYSSPEKTLKVLVVSVGAAATLAGDLANHAKVLQQFNPLPCRRGGQPEQS